MPQPPITSVDQAAREMNLKAIIKKVAEFAVTISRQSPSPETTLAAFRPSKSSRSLSNPNSRARQRTEELGTPEVAPELRKYGDE